MKKNKAKMVEWSMVIFKESKNRFLCLCSDPKAVCECSDDYPSLIIFLDARINFIHKWRYTIVFSKKNYVNNHYMIENSYKNGMVVKNWFQNRNIFFPATPKT